MRILIALITLMAITTAACGGAASTTADPAGGNQAGGRSSAAPDGGTTSGGDQSAASVPDVGGIEPEPASPVEPNTIRIGSQVWKRTLPMTTGQCFLTKADGTLPTWGVAWGTLDDNEDLHFSAKVGQDGAFSADVDDNTRNPTTPLPHWVAGKGIPVADLVVELDFDTQTIRGHGTYTDRATGKLASGSFEFICEG